MKGADIIAEFLINHGVHTAFGYPGANIIELYDALSDGRVQNIICRHEQGAVHAAVGYAKASGLPGVCIATSGPGAANLITGIADANLDSTPLIVITGQVPTSFIGRDAFQEADVMGMTIPVTKHNYLVKDGRELRATLSEAWELASCGRKGPVLIDVASNVLTDEIPDGEGNVRPIRQNREFPIDSAWDRFLPAFARASRPLILAGGGVVAGDADGALAKFAADNGIPVAVTLMAKGSMISEAEGVDFLGFAGKCGNERANRALSECDLLIASGTRFSERTVGDFSTFPKKFILHNDIDAAEISKNIRADAAAVCESREFFEALSEKITPSPEKYTLWRSELSGIGEPAPEESDSLTMNEVCRALEREISRRRDTVIVTDVGENQMSAALTLSPVVPRGFLTSGGLGTMGFGLPGAVGAAFASVDCGREEIKYITVVVGDGGFQMTEQELSTLAYSPIPVKIVLLDNGGLGMLRCDCRCQSFTLYSNPDFELLAKAYSIPCRTVSKRQGLDAGISEFLASPRSEMLRFTVK